MNLSWLSKWSFSNSLFDTNSKRMAANWGQRSWSECSKGHWLQSEGHCSIGISTLPGINTPLSEPLAPTPSFTVFFLFSKCGNNHWSSTYAMCALPNLGFVGDDAPMQKHKTATIQN